MKEYVFTGCNDYWTQKQFKGFIEKGAECSGDIKGRESAEWKPVTKGSGWN